MAPSTSASSLLSLGCLQRYFLLVLLSSSLFAYPGLALRWVRFDVPKLAVYGEDVLMTCEFDLEGDELYSVKWYKANREFYRYVPKEDPTIQDFPTPGINVVNERSNIHQMALKGVNLNTSGLYKCEVLAEAPHFRTLARSGILKVIAQWQPRGDGRTTPVPTRRSRQSHL